MERRLTRRAAAQMLTGAALALPLALVPGWVGATRTWCKTDPVVKIGGEVAHIYLASLAEMHEAATGPAQIAVTVPVGVGAELLAVDQGFGGHGYDVSFAESSRLRATARGLQVRVDVYAPATDPTLPVVVYLESASSRIGAADAEGTANAWVSLTSK